MKKLSKKERVFHLRLYFLADLPSWIQQNPYLFVGVKVVLKDETVLAIYVSKEKVLLNSDMYLSDLKEAKSILLKIQERIG